MRHVVALSGGKDSTALALRLRELNPETEYVYVSTPTGNEPPELFAHFETLESLLGVPILRLTGRYNDTGKVVGWREWGGGDELESLIYQEKMIPNYRARFCTRMLKIEPMLYWLADHVPCVHYVGLRADESSREGIYGELDGIEQRYPMRDEWHWGVEDIWDYLESRGVTIPERTDCKLCFFQRLIEWKRMYRQHPEAFAQGVKIEQDMDHTFRSPQRDTWPASLEELRQEFDSGRKVKGETDFRQRTLFGCDQEMFCRVCSM